jgi:uncharacterized protein YcnI
MKRHIALGALAGLAALTIVASASAHAHVSPPVALAKEGQVFTLAVPTEKENAQTTQIELVPPDGFSIDSFFPDTDGWKRSVQQTGSGEEAVIKKVTWTGGSVPTGEDAAFSFLGSTNDAGKFAFTVRQTYSDGSVVEWSGPESSDTPAPVIEAVSELGGGGSSTSTGVWIALAVGIAGVVLGTIALLAGRGRSLT